MLKLVMLGGLLLLILIVAGVFRRRPDRQAVTGYRATE